MNSTITPKNAKHIVVLTGAGISAESGIKTFRASDGLWEEHRVEDVATPEAFVKNPDLVHRFYNERRQQLLSGPIPNKAHLALAQFAKETPNGFTLITQNIDNLHEKAGSETIHMHGELLKMRCKKSNKLVEQFEPSSQQDICNCCQMKGNLRPHIVWFGEMPLFMNTIERALSSCDLFVAIGTSGNVYPAAGFTQMARAHGAHTVELNLEAATNHSQFAEQHYGLATQVVPEYFGVTL